MTVQAPPPTVTIVATDPTATEAGLTTGFFTVSRTGSTAAALTVSYTTDGTATAGSDYVGLAGSLTIPAGAGTATITVTPIDDSLVEGDETVVVTLSAGAGYAVGSPSSATVTIVSDDAFTDNPLISGVVIKAVHLTELRAAIDALRIRQGLAAFAWSDPMLGSGYTVKQVHLIEMRLALNDAYNKGGAGTPVYREPNIVSGQTAIHASHIQELRNFVLALE